MADESEIWDAPNSLMGLMGRANDRSAGHFSLNEQMPGVRFRNYYQRHYRAGRTLCH